MFVVREIAVTAVSETAATRKREVGSGSGADRSSGYGVAVWLREERRWQRLAKKNRHLCCQTFDDNFTPI